MSELSPAEPESQPLQEAVAAIVDIRTGETIESTSEEMVVLGGIQKVLGSLRGLGQRIAAVGEPPQRGANHPALLRVRMRTENRLNHGRIEGTNKE